MAEWSFRVFAGFTFLEAELKILSACCGVRELSIAVAKFERYGDEGAEGNDGVAEEDKKANDECRLERGLIFGGKNFNIAPAIARILVFH